MSGHEEVPANVSSASSDFHSANASGETDTVEELVHEDVGQASSQSLVSGEFDEEEVIDEEVDEEEVDEEVIDEEVEHDHEYGEEEVIDEDASEEVIEEELDEGEEVEVVDEAHKDLSVIPEEGEHPPEDAAALAEKEVTTGEATAQPTATTTTDAVAKEESQPDEAAQSGLGAAAVAATAVGAAAVAASPARSAVVSPTSESPPVKESVSLGGGVFSPEPAPTPESKAPPAGMSSEGGLPAGGPSGRPTMAAPDGGEVTSFREGSAAAPAATASSSLSPPGGASPMISSEPGQRRPSWFTRFMPKSSNEAAAAPVGAAEILPAAPALVPVAAVAAAPPAAEMPAPERDTTKVHRTFPISNVPKSPVKHFLPTGEYKPPPPKMSVTDRFSVPYYEEEQEPTDEGRHRYNEMATVAVATGGAAAVGAAAATTAAAASESSAPAAHEDEEEEEEEEIEENEEMAPTTNAAPVDLDALYDPNLLPDHEEEVIDDEEEEEEVEVIDEEDEEVTERAGHDALPEPVDAAGGAGAFWDEYNKEHNEEHPDPAAQDHNGAPLEPQDRGEALGDDYDKQHNEEALEPQGKGVAFGDDYDEHHEEDIAVQAIEDEHNDKEVDPEAPHDEMAAGNDELNKEGKDPSEEESAKRKPLSATVLALACVICLLIAAVAIMLPLLLTKDNSPSHSPPTAVPTPSPTSYAPSMSPTVGEPDTNPFRGAIGSGLGTSVVYSNNLVVAGAPRMGAGTIQTFLVNNQPPAQWLRVNKLEGDTVGSGFGTSVGLSDTILAVGAPFWVGATSRQSPPLNQTIGAVYAYRYNSGPANWSALGSIVTGGLANAGPNSNFGAAVATTAVNPFRIVVGAPYSASSKGANTGQAFLFEYMGTQWNLVNLTVEGQNENDGLGYSVAMSKDGSAFMVGAPGVGNVSSIGYGYMYQYNSSTGDWRLAFALGGIDAEEGFGSYVGILSDTADVIALGGPGNNNGSGYVLVYRSSQGVYGPLGNGIYGKPGDRIGEKGTVSGGTDANGTTHVILTTASGEVKRYDYNDANQLWEQTYANVQTGYMGGTTVADGGNVGGTSTFVVLGNPPTDQVALYQHPLLGQPVPPTEFFNAIPPTAAPSLAVSNTTNLPVATASPSSGASGSTPPPNSTATTPTPAPSVVGSSTGTTASPVAGTTASPSGGGGGAPTAAVTLSATTSSPTLATAAGAPSVAPLLTSTPSVSSATTSAPTLANLKTWTLTGGPLTLANVPNSGFGNAVTLSSSLLAVGAPFTFSNGSVITYLVQNGNASTTAQNFYGDQANAAFGYAVYASESSLLIGAPFEYVNQTTVSGGAAYYYSGSAGAMSQVGGAIRCYNGIYASAELCGASVATSANQIVVIGAPGNSVDGLNNRGAFYIQQYSGSSFAVVEQATGVNAKDGLGQAVDISSDGSVVLVGAPGGNYALVYEVTSGVWKNSFKIDTTDTSESLGTSVKVLSNLYVAVGAPGYGGGNGRIAVYERLSPSWTALPNLVGGPTDGYGASNSLSGSDSTVIVSSVTGQVKRYDYINGAWQQTSGAANIGSTITGLSSANSGQTFAASGNSQVSIYTLA